MGPLSGFKIIELAGLGPGPFCGMMLADMGADLVCVDRPGEALFNQSSDFTRRGKRPILLDLKCTAGREALLSLVSRADALFEGYRPGVMERLGLGPEECFKLNSKLVYGRITGWGQTGPLSQVAGHDINYIALNGTLFANGANGESPTPPVPPVGDFGGGAMFLAFGMVCALLEAQKSGQGQVVDAAMTEGSALLMTSLYSLLAQGNWSTERGSNLLDGGAHFYGVYTTSDNRHVAIGALEPQFYELLLEAIGADSNDFPPQYDRQHWPLLKEKMAAIFRTRTRDEWCKLLEGTDACFAPVLDMLEAAQHPHNRARQNYVEIDGQLQPAAAPRFSRTPAKAGLAPNKPGADVDQVLADWSHS